LILHDKVVDQVTIDSLGGHPHGVNRYKVREHPGLVVPHDRLEGVRALAASVLVELLERGLKEKKGTVY
jgi:hypothetical protein